jgi:hypothetical protein
MGMATGLRERRLLRTLRLKRCDWRAGLLLAMWGSKKKRARKGASHKCCADGAECRRYCCTESLRMLMAVRR